jgi:hypothetical protein
MFNWKAKYTITIGSADQRVHDIDIDIDDPIDQEILSSPFFKGDREKTRRYLVKRKADERITKLCNRVAVKTELPTTMNQKLSSLWKMV